MIKTEIRLELSYTDEDIISAICEKLPIAKDEIECVRLVKRSLNIKEKSDPHYRASVAFSAPAREDGLLKMKKKVSTAEDFTLEIPKAKKEPFVLENTECAAQDGTAFELKEEKNKKRPVVVGAGPAGLFAALIFAEGGARPIVLERGLDVDTRRESVENFYKTGILDEESNIQFGEGGAGAFSDGKLKYGAMDKYKYKVLSEFFSSGADESVLYSDTAHLGTDRLGGIIKNLREKIISLGGEFMFSARLADIAKENGRLCAAIFEKDGQEHRLNTDTLILAAGHSARDVFEMLLRAGASLTPRPFGIGVRVEHPREYINELIYGKNYDSRLPSANYHLVTHLPSGRSVYSFCMCPGGTVVGAASKKNRVVTNGMSEYARDGENSNSALLVSVTPEDFPSESPLAGLDFQAKIEKRAFLLGGGAYKAPALRMDDFCAGRAEKKPEGATYPLGVSCASFDEIFPEFITESLRAGIADFDRWLPGFYLPEAVLTAAETRSTSPVRVERRADFEAVGIGGLYPVGEGAGYSGGIVSSAVDGVKCALSVLTEKYCK